MVKKKRFQLGPAFIFLCLLLICINFVPTLILAQEKTVEQEGKQETQAEEEKEPKRSSWIALPIIFYTPETKWALGAGAIYYYRPKNVSLDALPSSIAATASYTQNKQWEFGIVPDIFFNNGEYRVIGFVNVRKWVDKFYGVGNDNPVQGDENYTTRTFNYYARFQKQLRSDFHLAVQHEYQYNNIIETEDGGRLDTGLIPGSEPNSISGLTLLLNWDSRDNLFAPYRGVWCEVSASIFRKWLGSDYTFERYNVNLRTYIPTFPRHVIALQSFNNFIVGEAPFQIMSFLGGMNFMRGYYMGRFRDNNAIILQGEYRADIWWRFGAAAFASVGEVAHKIDHFKLSDFKVTYGLGIRFAIDPKERLNFRLDFAWAEDSTGFYFTVVEAF
jgi:outer membrane protein assembly factor BamA